MQSLESLNIYILKDGWFEALNGTSMYIFMTVYTIISFESKSI